MRLDDIQTAQTTTTHHVSIPLQARDGDGTFHETTLEIDYYPLTEEVTSLRSVAAQLSKVIAQWNVEEEASFEVLSKRPLAFLELITEAIRNDYHPKKAG